VTSPTFTIVNEYEGRLPLFHFDLYRIGAEELEDIGWEDYLAREGVCAVEWSEKIEKELPDGCYRVHIARGDGDRRRICITKPEGGGS
jgi:tRNA threonylcarbamoyladenosine biosynthesis protein TsaE